MGPADYVFAGSLTPILTSYGSLFSQTHVPSALPWMVLSVRVELSDANSMRCFAMLMQPIRPSHMDSDSFII